MTNRTRGAVAAAIGAGLLGVMGFVVTSGPVPPGPYAICGVNLCGAGGELANAPALAAPCNVFQADSGGSTTAFAAKAGDCVAGKARAFVLERDWLGRSKMVSLGLAADVAVSRVDVSPDGAHVTFRAGRSEGAHNWRIHRADPHGGGSFPITPGAADGSHDVEPVWSIDCASGWIRYVEFDQVELRDRYVPITGGVALDVPPAGVVWPPCAAPSLIFRDGFEAANAGAWS